MNKILDLMPPVLVGWVIDSVRHEPPEWISIILGTDEPWNLAVFLAVLGVVIFFFRKSFPMGISVWIYEPSAKRTA